MALRKSDVEKAETCWVRTKDEGRALGRLLVLEQRDRADVVEARARARGAERAIVRRDIILAGLCCCIKAGKWNGENRPKFCCDREGNEGVDAAREREVTPSRWKDWLSFAGKKSSARAISPSWIRPSAG
jgi:hypothetical protein